MYLSALAKVISRAKIFFANGYIVSNCCKLYLFFELSLLTIFSVSLLFSISFLASSFNLSTGIISIIVNICSTCFFFWSSIVFICYSKAFPKEELVYYITLLWSEGTQPARNIPEIFAKCFFSVALFGTSR